MNNPALFQTLKALLFSVILAANIFLFVPVILYVGNNSEFVVPIGNILSLITVPALMVVLILVVTYLLLPGAASRRFTIFIVIAGLLFWAQGNLMVWDYGSLDGSRINWEQTGWVRWLDVFIWVIVAGLGTRFLFAVEKPLMQFSVAVFLMQTINLSVIFVRYKDELDKQYDLHTSLTSLQEIYKFSSSSNVFHIILDSFQSDIFGELVNNPEMGERYRTELDGFIFYPENSGIFPYTSFSLPAIVSNEIYRNNEPKDEFYKRVISGNTILNAAYEAGYEVDIASEAFMVDMLTKGNYTYSYLIPSNYHLGSKIQEFNETAKLLDLSLFRVLPYPLKKYIYNDQKWFLQGIFYDKEYWNYFYFAHTSFMHEMIKNTSLGREAPVYKFFHLMGPHAPIVVNPDCTYAGGVLPRTRQTVFFQSRCTLEYVIVLLDKMKEMGIYDDALIIIMADHGGHIPPGNFRPGLRLEVQDDDGKPPLEISAWLSAMVSPLMMIKTPGSSGALKISSVPASALDTAATINSVLKLGKTFSGTPIMQIPEQVPRERKFYYYGWRPEDKFTDYVLPIQEIMLNGSVYDASTWSLGEKYSPEKPE